MTDFDSPGVEAMLFEPTRVFLIRHGQTAWNAERRIQGHLDVALNSIGQAQAERLAAVLAAEPLAAIYCSDLQRACQTAAPLAACTGAPLRLDAALRERSFGHFEGLTYADIESRWPTEAALWRQRDLRYRPGDGEALPAFSARCVDAAARLAAAHGGTAIALVTHGGVLDCLYRAAAGVALDAPRSWALDNASVNRLLFNGEGFVLVGWDDRAHLDAG